MFIGLAIEKLETEWKKYPVLHISFAINKYVDFRTLQIVLNSQLCEWEKKYGVTKNSDDPGDRFATIIKEIHAKTGMQPVVLVDEYDAPILDSMDTPELQNTLKQEMRKFFSPLKNLGGIIRFLFLTGISKLSQQNFCSELNNLNVITMDD
ncbi:MAG: AAA family ATPase [Treponema sp.]|nr:AAA family ATPase [Treponema sp.]